MTNNYLFRQARIGVRKSILLGSMAEAVLSSGLLAVLGCFLYEGILFVIFTSMGKMPILSQIVPLLLRKESGFSFTDVWCVYRFCFHCVIEKSIYYFMHAVYLDLFVMICFFETGI